MASITQWITIIAVVLTGGWFSTMIVQVLKRPTWPSWTKLALAIIVSGLVGLAAVWLAGGLTTFIANWKHLTTAQILAVGALVYASAATWYHHYFAGTTWMQALGAWPAAAKSPPTAP